MHRIDRMSATILVILPESHKHHKPAIGFIA